MVGKYNNLTFPVLLPYLLDKLQTIHIRHFDIGNDEIRRIILYLQQSHLDTAVTAGHGIAQRSPIHNGLQRQPDNLLIIHQNGLIHRSPPSTRYRASSSALRFPGPVRC